MSPSPHSRLIMNKYWKLSMRAAMLGLTVGTAMNASSAPARATVSEAAARTTALAAVPSGTIQSAELETENGKLVWSFDIKSPQTSVITEIQVDANTGRVVSKKLESVDEQRKEAQGDKKAKP